MAPIPTAHLVHGFLGAGKTSFAKRLELDHDAVRFTHDDWMVALHGRDPPADRFPDHARRISMLMEELWGRCLAVGTDVVLDCGFWSRRERDRARALAAERGGTSLVYRLHCPDNIAWQRIERRNRAPDSLFIAPNTFRALRGRFEPLGPDEPCIEVGDANAGRPPARSGGAG